MRSSRLRLVLTGSALLAFAAPAAAQEASAPAGPPVAASEPEVPAEAAPAAPPIPAVWAPAPTDAEGRSAYGLYLSGRVAAFRGDRARSAALLARSQALVPEQPTVAEEAFRSGLFAGDLKTVVDLAPGVQGEPLLAGAGRLFEVVLNLEQGDGRAALAALRRTPFEGPYVSVGRYLAPVVAAAGGDWDAALQPVEAGERDPGGLILRLQRARLLEMRRRPDEAEAEFRALIALPEGARLFGVAYGEFLERRGRREEAAQQYRASLESAAPDPAALAGVQRLADGGRAPATPSLRQTAAEALNFAALEAGEYDLDELAAIYLRLSRSLAPSDLTALRLGLALAGAGQETPAQAAFAAVDPASPVLYAGAQYNLGLSLRREARLDEALAAFRRADAAAPGQTRVALELAGQLLASGAPAEALEVLDRPSVDTADQPPTTRFLRGAALEQLGRIPEAEAELWTALQARPDDPMLLNHLGYLWVDSGSRVEEGAAMIARAHAAEPENGNYRDSLGWAQYRQGLFEEAVETLEGAVEKEPANPEIVDHLGDAYWRVGRRREAAWQWNRVLTLEPDAERRAAIERKLTRGLPDPAASADGA